jgi:hypothetical protein
MAESYSFAKLEKDILSYKKIKNIAIPEMKNLKLMCHCEEERRSNLPSYFRFFFRLKTYSYLNFSLISPMEISLIFD